MKHNVSADLQTYVMDVAGKPWIDGENDCCTLAADWTVVRGHSDPMERWRGQYSTEVEAKAFIEDYGGLVSLWLVGMADAGIEETDTPEIGDIGIVRVLGENGPELVGAICSGRRWQMRSPRGIYAGKIKPLIAWRVR